MRHPAGDTRGLVRGKETFSPILVKDPPVGLRACVKGGAWGLTGLTECNGPAANADDMSFRRGG